MVNQHVAKEVVQMIDQFQDSPEIEQMALQIMVNSSSYKAGRLNLIQDNVLANILDLEVEGKVAQ